MRFDQIAREADEGNARRRSFFVAASFQIREFTVHRYWVWAALAAVASLSGCAFVPGPALDSSRIRDDSNKVTDATVYDVQLITPQLVYQLKLADEITSKDTRVFPQPAAPDVEEDYRVGVSDVLGITVWAHPELTQAGVADAGAVGDTSTIQSLGSLGGGAPPPGAFGTNGAGEPDARGQRVSADGSIFMPTVGRFRVAGMTTQDIAQRLRDALATQIRNPQIDVRVIQFRSQRIAVTGDVRSPGQLSLTGTSIRVVDAISRAGGGNGDADLQRVVVSRNGQTRTIDVERILNRGDLRENIVLRADDIVHVPDHTQNRVFVMGEVAKPQTVFMTQGKLTLADALSNAGSIDPMGANPRQILVIRHPSPQGDEAQSARYEPAQNKPQIYRLDMTQVDGMMLATEFDMKPLDVVYVDPAIGVRFNRLLAQIMPAAESFYLMWSVTHNR